MKDKLNRLAKGIMEEELPELSIKPEAFEETVCPDRPVSFALEIESLTGRTMRGACSADEYRIDVQTPSFMGRVAHVSFLVDASGLQPGDELAGALSLITSAGEFAVPYHFTVRKAAGLYGKENFGASSSSRDTQNAASGFGKNTLPDAKAFGCVTAESRSFLSEDPTDGQMELFREDPEAENRRRIKEYRSFLASRIPEDPELLQAVCELLIRENGDNGLAFAFLDRAVKSGANITHLYESYLATWPEDRKEEMAREVLLYFSYEQNLVPLAADRLYRNVICHEPETSDLYRQYEPRMREHAAKSLLDGRMNVNLKYIYDRMVCPDMIDAKTAGIVPDLVRAHRITVENPRAVTVHVKYPELKKLCSVRFKDGQAYVPVWSEQAEISFHDADGGMVPVDRFTNEKLADRPDLLRRSFELKPDHPMLMLMAVKEQLSRGVHTEEDKQILLHFLSTQDLEPEFRAHLIRTLCRAGGDASWIGNIPLSELDAETGNFAFRAFLAAERRKEAYLYLRETGLDGKAPEDLSALATSLLEHDEKPVTGGQETDRFFVCLCKRIYDRGRATEPVMGLLTGEYEGSSEEMYGILAEADRNHLPVGDLPERLLTVLLFAENRKHLDETFLIYLKKEAQKENLLRAFFTLRMTDYFEREDRNVDPGVFEALTSYLNLTKFHETMPVIYLLGLTKHYSEKETLNAKELELCQKLTDLLIGRGLVFAYTKKLRKKIRIPASICERFYVEYAGGPGASPRMIARIFPDEAEYAPVNLNRVYANIFVASMVLFLGEEMHYLVYDDAIGKDPAEQGVISVRKMHGKSEDRFLHLNRMTRDLSEGNLPELSGEMFAYAADTEVNRELFRIEN